MIKEALFNYGIITKFIIYEYSLYTLLNANEDVDKSIYICTQLID